MLCDNQVVYHLLSVESFGSARFQNSQLGKDPTVETSFLPDRCGISLSPLCVFSLIIIILYFFNVIFSLIFKHRVVEDDILVRVRLRNKLSVKGCGNSGYLSRSGYEVIMHYVLGFYHLNT